MKALNTMSLAGFFALGLAKGIFAQISATNVLETWKAGAIPEISYHFESTVYRWDMAARDDATREEIFSFALSDGPPVVMTTKGFVFWISGVGMRAKFDHVSEFNLLLNGVATNVSQDDNPSRTKTVSIRKPEDPIVTSDAKSELFLSWFEPASTKIATLLSANPDLDITFVDSEGQDQLAILKLEAVNGSILTARLSRKFGWRVVSEKLEQNGELTMQKNLEYELGTDGAAKLVGWEMISFQNSKPWRREKSAMTEMSFACRASDLELEIPANSVVSDYTDEKLDRYLVRDDGSKRRFSMEEVFNAANMQQLMDTEEGDLLPSRNSPKTLATLTPEQAKFLKSLEGQWIRNKVLVDRKGFNEKVTLKAVIIKKATFEFVGLNDLKRQFKCTRISVKDQEVDLATIDAEQPLRYLMKLDGQTMWLVAKANDKYEAPWATEPINYDQCISLDRKAQ